MIDKLMENERYEEALMRLNAPKDEEEYYKKIVCLYSLKRYNEAVMECDLALELAEKFYYDITAIYVTCLIELNEDEKAIKILEEELQMPYIPYKYEVQFNASYDELLKRRAANSKVDSPLDMLTDEELTKSLLTYEDNVELVILLNQLKRRNIRRFLPLIEDMLVNENVSSQGKTIILELLKEQEVNKTFKINKDGETIDVDISKLDDVLMQSNIEKVLEIIEDNEDFDDINFYDYCKDVIYSFSGYIFPKVIEDKDNLNLAGAVTFYVYTLMGIEVNEKEFFNKYQLEKEILNKYINIFAKAMKFC